TRPCLTWRCMSGYSKLESICWPRIASPNSAVPTCAVVTKVYLNRTNSRRTPVRRLVDTKVSRRGAETQAAEGVTSSVTVTGVAEAWLNQNCPSFTISISSWWAEVEPGWRATVRVTLWPEATSLGKVKRWSVNHVLLP